MATKVRKRAKRGDLLRDAFGAAGHANDVASLGGVSLREQSRRLRESLTPHERDALDKIMARPEPLVGSSLMHDPAFRLFARALVHVVRSEDFVEAAAQNVYRATWKKEYVRTHPYAELTPDAKDELRVLARAALGTLFGEVPGATPRPIPVALGGLIDLLGRKRDEGASKP